MPVVMSARQFAKWHYECDEPTVTQMNTVNMQCRDGSIRHAEKVGRKWFINCTAEWPELFPEPEKAEVVRETAQRAPIVTADMRLGDALAVLLDALAGKEVANVH
ncbi:MAG: hypothetical protein IJ087_09985 [Eggerthellaceae bacterium]|nr:hypothetical protein [Eggerthellaceae bacterium]